MDIDEILEATAADFFWVPPHVEVVEREPITYTHSTNPSALYNRVVRVRPERADPESLVAEVRRAHAGRPSRWMLTPMGDTPELRRALAQAGYEEGERHVASSIGVAEYGRKPPADVEVRQVRTPTDLRLLYEIVGEVFGEAPELSEADLAREVGDCTGPERRVARFIAYRGGEPAGTGGMTFFDDLGFGLIWAGGVREAHRGRGVYTALLAARAEVAARRGVDTLGLYARVETSAPIVAAHGFVQHGTMVYYQRPPGSAHDD
jgi:GNAT superfamily N-acetyltransferase